MKIAIISDVHFNAFKPFATYDCGENSRLTEIVDAFREAVSLAAVNGCRALFVCGDLFHTRGALRPSVFNRVFFEVEEAAEDMEIVIIPGNHDMENYRGGATAVDTLAGIRGVRVIKEPNMVEVGDLLVGGIPYIHDHAEFLREFAAMANDWPKVPDCFLIHQGVDNFATPGMPETTLTAERLATIFAGPIFTGHYHVARKDGTVISPGSLVQHGFGETQEPKGVWLWDTDSGDIRLVPVAGPSFVTVATKKEAEQTDGCYVRVKADTLAKAEKIKAAAMEVGAKGVVIVLDKKFTTAHASPLTLATPKEMLVAWLGMQPETKGREGALMALFEAICAGGAAA